MKIHFWGVRGSLPTPLSPEEVRGKIAACISRVTPDDLKDEDSKMRFLNSLPSWIYGTTGGNTACVSLLTKDNNQIILDCGSGLRSFSQFGKQPEDLHYHIFISHFHWDHIQGLPFFGQSFNPKAKIDIYTCFTEAEKYLEGQSSVPYFPENGCYHAIKNQITFHYLNEGEEFKIGNVKINSRKMKHPGNSYSYSFEENGKKFIFATDTELQMTDFDKDDSRNKFFKNADVLVLDAQYTNIEALHKENWGHSSFSDAIDFASLWGVKSLYFFHHEPAYDDKKLFTIFQDGQKYLSYLDNNNLELKLAVEGGEIEL